VKSEFCSRGKSGVSLQFYALKDNAFVQCLYKQTVVFFLRRLLNYQ